MSPIRALLASAAAASAWDRVSTLLKDLRCGGDDRSGMDVPHFLQEPGLGLGKVMVDVGLDQGQETVAAVRSGFTVYSFEPRREAIQRTAFNLRNASLDYQHVRFGPGNELAEPLRKPAAGRGISYLFHAGAGATHTSLELGGGTVGASFVDQGSLRGATRRVRVVPVADYVHEDVWFFKSDTQGYEMDVLAGARPLFDNYEVRLVKVEFWPRGLKAAGHASAELVDALVDDLGFFCFTSEAGKRRHPEAEAEFREFLRAQENDDTGRWGWFDDLMCVRNHAPAACALAAPPASPDVDLSGVPLERLRAEIAARGTGGG